MKIAFLQPLITKKQKFDAVDINFVLNRLLKYPVQILTLGKNYD